jgi:hypothetical protein
MPEPVDEYPWPRWRWPERGWLWTAASGALGLIIFVFPDVTRESIVRRLALAVLVAVAPFVCALAWHGMRLGTVTLRRARAYEGLRAAYNRRVTDLEAEVERTRSAVGQLLQERASRRAFEILNCFVYQGDPYIVLRRKRGIKLERGNLLTVMDAEGFVMGSFAVVEVREQEYRARSTGDMDPLWQGYIHEAAPTLSPAPPNARAFLLHGLEVEDE